MRARLKWRWDDELGDEERESAAATRRSRWLLWGFLLLVAILGTTFYRQQVRRVQRQEEAIEADVRASYGLWHSAVTLGDLELFLFQLSNQSTSWQSEQQKLFLLGRLLDRPELGLYHTATGTGVEAVDVALGADWKTAAVAADYSYAPRRGEFADASLRLQQSHFYRRIGERWLLSPGDDAFWGPQQRLTVQGLTVLYPQRDAQIVERIGGDLADDLKRLCGTAADDSAACLQDLQLTVRFEHDALLLASMRDSFTPLFRDGGFVLPTPTLVGLPLDDATYAVLYEGYTSRILNAVRQNLAPPLPLPEQPVQLLCFSDEGRALQLYRYEPASDRWTAELTDRSYRFLVPGPRGEGVILQAATRGEEATHLRLYWWREGREQLVFDQEMQKSAARPAAWSASEHPHLLLQGATSANVSAQHRWLDLDNCDEDGCTVVELPGYTVWSPNGRRTLVLDERSLWRGDALGQPHTPLGAGLSPFWLDDETYVYVRYDREAGAPSMQIATSTVGNDLPRIVKPVAELARLLDEPEPPLLYINYVAVNPADRDLLFISATTLGPASSKYNIFSLHLSSGEVELLQQFEQPAIGSPPLLTPAGYAPFRLSSDGRWMLVTHLESPSPTTWSLQLYDLREQQALTLNVRYPEYPSRFPFYDWTADGNWLVVVEDGFLRLIAPDYHYQKLVTHEQEDCFYAAWVRG